ncbi:MAG: hypothetical protein KGZ94_00065 [Clostridia bacterium]|nr:hypothetical protein [Clostridia bacterium]
MGANFKTDIIHNSTTKFSGVRGGHSDYKILLPSWNSITLPDSSAYNLNFYIGLDFVDPVKGVCRQEAGISIKGDEFNNVNKRGWRYFWNSTEGEIYNSRNHGDLKITDSFVILTLKAEEGPSIRTPDTSNWDTPGTTWGNRARSRVKFYLNGNYVASAWVPSASDTKNCYFPKFNAGCEFYGTPSAVKHTEAINFQRVYGIRWEGSTPTEVYNLLSTSNYTINGTRCWHTDGQTPSSQYHEVVSYNNWYQMAVKLPGSAQSGYTKCGADT